MTTATVGSRFQVVIPKEVRQRLGIKPLSRMNVEARKDCIDQCNICADACTNTVKAAGAKDCCK